MKNLNFIFIIICTIYWFYVRAMAEEWSHHLMTFLKQDTKMNQLLLLHDDDFNNCEILHMVKSNLGRIPTRVVDFKNIIEGDGKKLMLPPGNFPATTVVVIMGNDYQNSSKIIKLLDSVAAFTHPKTRSKVLITTIDAKDKYYKNVLKLLWGKQFLDVSILEIHLRSEGKMLICEKNVKCRETSPKFVNLIYYNPFNNRFYKTRLSETSILFPDKLREMKGYKMKINLFHFPPYIYIKRNSNGNVSNVYGPDVNLVMLLSNVLNFSLEMVIYNISHLPKISCNKDHNRGIVGSLIFNEAEFIVAQATLIKTCIDPYLHFSQCSRVIRYVFLVPILATEATVATNEWQPLTLMGVFSLNLLPWLIARFLNFDQSYWKLIYAVPMVLGFTTPKNPDKTIERIIFMTLLLFFFFQSTYIFTAFSSLQLQKKTFKKLETIEDLLLANLTPITHGNLAKDDDINATNAYQKLMENSIFSKQPIEKCVQTLMDHKNVSCIVREDLARKIIENISKQYEHPRIKMLKEVENVYSSQLILTGGSPFKSRIEFFTSILMKSGISKKWDDAYIPKSLTSQSEIDLFKLEISLISRVLKSAIVLLLFGQFLSLLTFTAEIIVCKYLKN